MGTRHLGTVFVKGFSLFPKPAAKSNAIIYFFLVKLEFKLIKYWIDFERQFRK